MDGDENAWEGDQTSGLVDGMLEWIDGEAGGGEDLADRTYVHNIAEMLSDGLGGSGKRKHIDHRTRSQRLERLESSWMDQIDNLATALMDFRLKEASAGPPVEASGIEFPIIDLHTRKLYALINFEGFTYPGEAMINAGYMPTSPISLQLGISIATISLYHHLRLRQPSFSVQAFSKVICDVYKMPYKRSYRDLLGRTFEVYVRLSNTIEKQVQTALGRIGEDWRAKNACPPCTYKLEDEPDLTYERIIAMDGNNSLKRTNRAEADQRTFEDGDLFIPTSYVDRFANQVRPTTQTQQDTIAQPAEGDPTDGDDDVTRSGCASRWKAASADSVKKMWALFDETGVFASACRHGLLLWVVDMVKSGELAKYPLSTVSKVMETLGERVLIGFDIGCSFSVTVASSSLAQRFREQGHRVCMNAFHGYAHNYTCQMLHHPLGIEGTGLEDMETMERVFSASNALARLIRYSTRYARRLYIAMHYKQWDEDKYLNLGQMLVGNYRQALKIISEETITLDNVLQGRSLTTQELDGYLEGEKVYLMELKQGKERTDYQVWAYVELLENLRDANDMYDKSRGTYNNTLKTFSFIDNSQPEEYTRAAARTG